MPTLSELLSGGGGMGSPNNNPEIEQMLGRLGQMQSPGGASAGGMPTPPAPGPAPMGQGAPMTAPQAAPGAPAQPEQANATYQMLIKAGLPPEIAQQAMQEPKFLQEILLELQKSQQLGVPPQAQQMAPEMGNGPGTRPVPQMR
jgi:hypothetical protein